MISIPTSHSKGSITSDRLSKSTQSLVIIDSSVENIQQLKAGLKQGAEVVVLHPQLNGIEQITALISRRKNLQKVHLVSHGNSASLKLGSSELNLDNIDDYSAQLQTWFGSGEDCASLLVYGCQVANGAKGRSFIQKLYGLTRANVAAATRTVGSSSKGGTWQLDYTVGEVEHELAFSEEVIQTYSGVFIEEELLAQIPTVEDEEEIAIADEISAEEESVVEEPIAEESMTEEDLVDETIVEDESVAEEDLVEEPIVEDESIEEPVAEEEAVVEELVEEPVAEEETVEEPIAEEEVVVEEELLDEELVDEPVVDDEPVADGELVDELVVEEELPDEELVDEPIAEEELLDEPEFAEELIADEAVGEESIEGPIGEFNDLIDLSNVSDQKVTFTAFDVSREAKFGNTVDFYEVNADGSVTDDSGETIAVGEEGYTEAALDNRVGLELATENGTVSEFSTELQGGKLYAPLIAVDSSIEALTDDNPDNDPAIYFTYSDANVDGFDHIRSPRINLFEFEDLPNGGDEDFNDLVVDVSFQEESLIDLPVDEPIVEEPVVDVVVDEPVVEPVVDVVVEEPAVEPVVEEVVDEPVVEEVADEPIVEEVVDEPVVEEPVVDEPVTEEASEDSSTLTNFEGTEIQYQAFYPDLETPRSEPITAIVGDGVEFPADEVLSSDNPGDNIFIADENIDITGGVAGEGSIIYEIGENQTPATLLSGDFNAGVFTDVSGDLPPIENVTLDESATTFGLESSDLTFTEDTIVVNFESLDIEPGLTAKIDVDFADV